VVFRIFWEGEEYEDLVRLVREKKLEGIIEICPKTDNAEREYRGAGFYVLSSRRDTFPLVLLEAKSCGLPVVSFNCPEGPAHIVQDGVDGILVEDGNVKALSQAILKMIEEPETRKRYGREAAEDALRRFSPESVFEMWEELFAGLIGKE
jgi:glycosyltransferase involved in cell wall biosynthesis